MSRSLRTYSAVVIVRHPFGDRNGREPSCGRWSVTMTITALQRYTALVLIGTSMMSRATTIPSLTM